jgi:hypothetical protein
MNRRFVGMPRGVYLGYTPFIPPGSTTLFLLRDPLRGFSTLKVGTRAGDEQIDIYTDRDLEFDFAGHVTWPVYVIATAVATDNRPRGTIFTRATTASGRHEVLICKVDLISGQLVVSNDVPANQNLPIAFDGQQFGFMKQGAITELGVATSVNAEVDAAKTSIFTGPHSSLKARIDDDTSGSQLANRLGLSFHEIVGNAYSGVTGGSVNVSGSFSETSRRFAPFFSFEPGGSELAEGVITAPVDTVRNICFLIDETTGNRIVDEVSPTATAPSLSPVFGRLTYSTGSNGPGKQINFTQASTTVSGGGTNPFVAPLQQGDLIRGVDGLYYELRTITGPDNAVLASAYRGNTGFVVDTIYRRYTLSFFSAAGAYSILTARHIRFSFPAFFRQTRNVFDGWLYMRRTADLPLPPVATTSVVGRVLRATDGANTGTVSAENSGTPIGSNFHTLNFTTGGASNTGGGVASVSVPGPIGPAGPDSDVGPQGPQGNAGAGYNLSAVFQRSVDYVAPLVAQSFSNDFNATHGFTSLAAVTGGFARLNIPAGFTAVTIDSISMAGTTGTIVFTADLATAEYAVYLGGCGS